VQNSKLARNTTASAAVESVTRGEGGSHFISCLITVSVYYDKYKNILYLYTWLDWNMHFWIRAQKTWFPSHHWKAK